MQAALATTFHTNAREEFMQKKNIGGNAGKDPTVKLHKQWQQALKQYDTALEADDEAFHCLPEYAQRELDIAEGLSVEERTRLKLIQDESGYTRIHDKKEAIAWECDALEKKFLSSIASSPEGLLLQAQEILNFCEMPAFDAEKEDNYINNYKRNAIRLSRMVVYGSSALEKIEEAKELLREAKTVQRIRKMERDVLRVFRKPSPSEITLSSYKPITEHDGTPITYVGEYILEDGKGLIGLGRKWRCQQVKYGNLPLVCAEFWDGYKRWFYFDDDAVREYYKTTNTKPNCNYTYLSDYPPHPGEDKWHYTERMNAWHVTFGLYMALKIKEREEAQSDQTS